MAKKKTKKSPARKKIKKSKAPAKTTTSFRNNEAGRKKFYEDLKTNRDKHSRGGEFYKFAHGKTVARLIPFMHNGSGQLFASDRKHFTKTDAGVVNCPKGDDPDNDCALCDKIDDHKSKLASQVKFTAHFVIQKDPLGTDLGTSVVAAVCKSLMTDLTDIVLDEDGVYKKKGVKDALDHDFEIVRGKDRRSGFVTYDASIVTKKCKPVDPGNPRDLIAARKSKDKSADELAGIAGNL